jgi:hypothetical protein
VAEACNDAADVLCDSETEEYAASKRADAERVIEGFNDPEGEEGDT